MHLPERIVHGDWSVDPKKRRVAVADREGDHYRINLVTTADAAAVAAGEMRRLAGGAGAAGRLLVGFDFPLGLPVAYARQVGISYFPDLLAVLGTHPWDHFTEVATCMSEVGLFRPFFPARPRRPSEIERASRAAHASALGLTPAELRRRCDGRDAETIFWTLGPSQVGKAALAGWGCLRSAPEEISYWPFAGPLERLLAPYASVVVAETYPREFYRYIRPARPGRGSKRRQSDRQAWAAGMLRWSESLDVTWADEVSRKVDSGFGPGRYGEDEFDAVAGVLGLVAVATGRIPPGEPADPEVRRVEGWMLGRPYAGPDLVDSDR